MSKILYATRGGEASYPTQDAVIQLAKKQGDEIIFLYVVDLSFLNNTAAPRVVDIDLRLEKLGRFQLSMAKERAAEQGVDAEAIVQHDRLQTALIEVAKETHPALIVFGKPLESTAVFKEEVLRVFAEQIRDETGIEVRIM